MDGGVDDLAGEVQIVGRNFEAVADGKADQGGGVGAVVGIDGVAGGFDVAVGPDERFDAVGDGQGSGGVLVGGFLGRDGLRGDGEADSDKVRDGGDHAIAMSADGGGSLGEEGAGDEEEGD